MRTHYRSRFEALQPADVCTYTQIRNEACVCGTCVCRRSPEDKRRANKRDVLALLDLVAGYIANHPSQTCEKPTWGDVSNIANLRGRLMGISVGFGLRPDGDEQATRCRIEEALCTEDEHVDQALIEAL